MSVSDEHLARIERQRPKAVERLKQDIKKYNQTYVRGYKEVSEHLGLKLDHARFIVKRGLQHLHPVGAVDGEALYAFDEFLALQLRYADFDGLANRTGYPPWAHEEEGFYRNHHGVPIPWNPAPADWYRDIPDEDDRSLETLFAVRNSLKDCRTIKAVDTLRPRTAKSAPKI